MRWLEFLEECTAARKLVRRPLKLKLAARDRETREPEDVGGGGLAARDGALVEVVELPPESR